MTESADPPDVDPDDPVTMAHLAVIAGDAPGALARMPDVLDEVQRLRDLVNPELSITDLELRVRDGHTYLQLVGAESGSPAMRFLAAIMLNAILDDGEGGHTEPPNYRCTQIEWDIKPAGGFDKYRMYMEVIKPGGRSSHELRATAEARVAALEADARDTAELIDRIRGAADETFYRGREVRNLTTGKIGLVVGVGHRSGLVAVEFDDTGTEFGFYDRSDLEPTGTDFDDQTDD